MQWDLDSLYKDSFSDHSYWYFSKLILLIQENLCGQRGLLPNTDNQTFQMAVPKKLRTQYDKVLIPINAPQVGQQPFCFLYT